MQAVGGFANLGKKYQKLAQNIYQNNYLERLQNDLKNQGVKADLNLYSNKIRSEKFNSLDTIFEENVLKREFYCMAKQGKLMEDESLKNKILWNYYQSARENYEVPFPHFTK